MLFVAWSCNTWSQTDAEDSAALCDGGEIKNVEGGWKKFNRCLCFLTCLHIGLNNLHFVYIYNICWCVCHFYWHVDTESDYLNYKLCNCPLWLMMSLRVPLHYITLILVNVSFQMTFTRPANHRQLTFTEIAQSAKIPVNEVSWLMIQSITFIKTIWLL